jgi:hypothetical protein
MAVKTEKKCKACEKSKRHTEKDWKNHP